MEGDIEILKLTFERHLVLASVEQLVELAGGLNVEGVDVSTRKTRIMKAFRDHLYSNWGETLEENLAFLQRINEEFQKGFRIFCRGTQFRR